MATHYFVTRESPKLRTLEIANTWKRSSGHRESPVAKHGGELLRTSQCRSKYHTTFVVAWHIDKPSEPLEYHDRIIERRLAVHAELNATDAANDASWSQQGWHASNYQHFFTTEEVADNTGSNQQIEILDQMNSVEGNAMQEQRTC